MEIRSLFDDVPDRLANELYSPVLETKQFRLVRIVSTGQATPDGEWYDQDQNEWIIILRGRARILFADGDGSKHLGPGEYLRIPAHVRHRVEETDPDQPTIWLALYY